MRSRFNSIMFPALFLAVFCANTFFLQQSILGVFLLGIYLLWVGKHTSDVFRFREGGACPSPTGTLWIGIWLLLSVIMILGSVAYYVAFVPAILFQGIVIVSTVVVAVRSYVTRSSVPVGEGHAPPLRERVGRIRSAVSFPIALATFSVLFLLTLLFHFLQVHQITNAIRSPWNQIPVSLLILFFLSALIVSALLYRGREKTVSLFLFILLIGSLFSFIAITYPIGYGFDSFIHKATEAHLAQFGTIQPKPFYYIGQYSIVLFFSHAFSLPIDLVDTWLLPLLASLLLPLAWFSAAKTILKKPRYALFTLLGLFLLPLDAFIVTTPQGLANLWIELAILASIPWLFEEESPNWIFCAIVTVATFLIHPIAGIPLFFFFLLLFLQSTLPTILPVFTEKRTQILTWVFVMIGALALPASFVVQSIKSGQGLHLTFGNLNPVLLLKAMNLDIFFQNRFNPLLDFVYVYGQNAFAITLVISVGVWWMYRKDLSKKINILFLMLIILVVNYLLLANVIDFSFLIDYERANYANRIIPLILFFASPFIILAFGHLSMNLRTKPIALKFTCVVLIIMCATATFYLAFPREDAYTTSHAFNVSQADVDAVYLIEDWAKGQPYIALANQSVSAAAIKDIGFRYYGNLFFYPIPTGEAMYQTFLDMNTTPTRTTINTALALIPKEENVHTVFYVIDTYWWQADQLIEKSKAIADDWKSIDNSVYIFRFDEKE